MDAVSTLLKCLKSKRFINDIEKAKAEEKKHMTFLEAAHVAKDAQVKEMWLTHYSPSLLHPEEYMKSVKKVFDKAYPGKDGKSIMLEFADDENRRGREGRK